MERSRGRELDQAPGIIIKEPSFKDLEPQEISDNSAIHSPIYQKQAAQKSNYSNASEENLRHEPPLKRVSAKMNNFVNQEQADDHRNVYSKSGDEKSAQEIRNSSSTNLMIPNFSKKSARGDKRSDVVHTSEKFIVNEQNPTYQLPFVFTEEEIAEAFETLDINKQNYITRDEVSFFLDILGEQVSDAELDEMVRMLDIERTQKVYLKEFTRMAMGKSLSPIGIAYPPTLPMLEKQNINKMSNVDVSGKIKATGDQVAFIKNKGSDKDDADFAAKKRAQIDKSGKDINQARRKEVEARERLIKSVMEETKLDIGKAITRMKLKKQREIKECSLKMFAHIIEQPEDNNIKIKYDSLCASGPPLIDIREFLTNCVAFNGWTNKEKAKVAFSIFDHENTNHIYFEDFVMVICWLNFETMSDAKFKAIAKPVSKIFEEKQLKRTDPLTRLVFDQIINEHQSILFTHQSKLNKSND